MNKKNHYGGNSGIPQILSWAGARSAMQAAAGKKTRMQSSPNQAAENGSHKPSASMIETARVASR